MANNTFVSAQANNSVIRQGVVVIGLYKNAGIAQSGAGPTGAVFQDYDKDISQSQVPAWKIDAFGQRLDKRNRAVNIISGPVNQ